MCTNGGGHSSKAAMGLNIATKSARHIFMNVKTQIGFNDLFDAKSVIAAMSDRRTVRLIA